MNLRIFEDRCALIAGAAEAIINRVRSGDRIIGLSGGSTPKPLYEHLGRNDELREAPITWVVVDERFVPFADPKSNARMITETLFARGIAPTHRFLKFETDVADAEASAADFESEWRRLGIERLDLATLGVGDDGHTASLFPRTPVLDVTDRIAAPVYVPRLDSWRVTLTMPVLREAKARWVFAAGSEKRKILEEIRGGADYPAARVMSVTDSWWLVDRAAVEG
jgi:6-phosphogluconolactonase